MSTDELIELADNLRKGVPIATPVFDGAREDDIDAHAGEGRAATPRAR